jgi:hypothetical protein
VRELVIYLDVAASQAKATDELARRVRELPEVGALDVRVEDSERSLGGIDIASITLTLTAAAGLVGGATLLLDKIRGLVTSVRGLRQVMVETPSGPKPLDSVTPKDFEKS